jgi:hypothetical protein
MDPVAVPDVAMTQPDALRDLYLDLILRCITNSLYDDDLDLLTRDESTGLYRQGTGAPVDPIRKYYGWYWPTRAHTMVGMPQLSQLRCCAQDVIERKVAGDFIEAGVWRGGSAIFMRAILRAHDITDRTVWVADSFKGLPEPNRTLYPQETTFAFHRFDALAVPLDQVKLNFERYGLLDAQVRFLEGWFRDTLPAAPIERLAVMRLDGDMYESTMDALVALYPKLSLGGYVLVDDYNNVPSCTAAVDDFRRAHDIPDDLSLLPRSGAFWQRRS